MKRTDYKQPTIRLVDAQPWMTLLMGSGKLQDYDVNNYDESRSSRNHNVWDDDDSND